MTDTPSAAPQPPGDKPAPGGGTGQGPGSDPSAPYPPGHGRHEMPGAAGYPQFEGPGAAQYGNEPVEPAPPLGRAQPHPTYGSPGTGPDPQAPTYGYQSQSGTGVPSALDVGHALSYGWEKFRRNPGPWLAVSALGLVIYLLFVAVVQVLAPRSALTVIFIFLAVMAGLWLLQAAMVRGALYETNGYPATFGSYFHIGNAGNVLLTAVLAFLATVLASTLCLLPGIAVGMGCMFSLHFVVDQNQGPIEAITSSVKLVIANIWPVLLLTLTVMVVALLGVLACGFGLLVAGPVATIAVTYAYRTMTGGEVSAI
ncbi:hypothetical protein GV794_07490 [Nocardia cyriacigeorgica]|uniref:Integral membrane protein n=1 Tax=Nocardia cyriacigeorgica TaxID=135487 RepID=A0A6P1CYF6_9NOCA|nr:hypothetical protein [Nocardia cyriacigeorgica]NEW40520.1 hypothetical protein [Nocardia cyriacigeorgica]NEW43027.1 hypothetical protein [Nocardia cyriacigeorgica]NEW51685.1 hypothetical protein [Nocardia cyriacigeorgica]NEW55495.1 hypothetical protein [Nocardia cyriacigeorgica]